MPQTRRNCRPQALRQDAGECVITGSRIVHACHVIPHSLGDAEYRRICGGADRNEAANLVLLTPTLHAAFDRSMFSFVPTGRGTHAVEVYVPDPALDPHAGKIVRLAAGDRQLAAHRAGCRYIGRQTGAQDRTDDDPDWDARTAFSTACSDVLPAARPAPAPCPAPFWRRTSGGPAAPAPPGSVEWASNLLALTDDEQTERFWLGETAESALVKLIGAINLLSGDTGITLPAPDQLHRVGATVPAAAPTSRIVSSRHRFALSTALGEEAGGREFLGRDRDDFLTRATQARLVDLNAIVLGHIIGSSPEAAGRALAVYRELAGGTVF